MVVVLRNILLGISMENSSYVIQSLNAQNGWIMVKIIMPRFLGATLLMVGTLLWHG